MNTEQITKSVKQHSGKIASGAGTLSVGTLIFLFTHFATNESLDKHCDRCDVKHSELWQKQMDHELEIDRLKRQ